jgi:hypothetical protein
MRRCLAQLRKGLPTLVPVILLPISEDGSPCRGGCSSWPARSRGTLEAYRLQYAPQLIVVSPQGRIERTWYAPFMGPRQRELESFFGLSSHS